MDRNIRTTIFFAAIVVAAVGIVAVWAYSLRSQPSDAVGVVAAESVQAVLNGSAPVVPPDDTVDLEIPATAPVASENSPTAAPAAERRIAKPGPFILFYGDGCPHCVKVEWYLDQNDIRSQVDVTLKEVYNDRANADNLAVKAKACGIPLNRLGVPLLWTGVECLTGDAAIIDFFESAVGR